MQRLHLQSRANARTGGFSLIEVLAVVLILGLLFAFLVPNLFSGQEGVKRRATQTWITQLSAEIEAYEREKGAYPASTFSTDLDPKPSRTNMGIEALVIALLPADGSYRATGSFDDRLCNTDGDTTKTSLTRFQKSDAFELSDEWDNPLVYLHRRDYEKGCQYLTYHEATSEFVEEKVKAAVNPTTGSPYRPDAFQILSAGPDGQFGTA
ncbi:MAG: prepilin-type N-terminal cleavage/methylation domain-containing protein, partial [Planctomycetota bacterium]